MMEINSSNKLRHGSPTADPTPRRVRGSQEESQPPDLAQDLGNPHAALSLGALRPRDRKRNYEAGRQQPTPTYRARGRRAAVSLDV